MATYDCTLPKVRVYKGSRYIPLFADPLQWDKDTAYSELTVVYNCGRTWISKTCVPAGSPLPEYPLISNEWWALYADYNIQLEHYREEVRSFSLRYDKMFCYLQDRIADLEALVDQYYKELTQKIENLEQKVDEHYEEFKNFETTTNNKFTEMGDKYDQAIADILAKIYLGGEFDPETGTITFPTTDKIAIGNMNVYAGNSQENFIKTDADGENDYLVK